MAESKQGVKRSRSGSSANASGEDEAPVVKKDRSLSLDMYADDRNKIAILDAGAQYGKVRGRLTEMARNLFDNECNHVHAAALGSDVMSMSCILLSRSLNSGALRIDLHPLQTISCNLD